MTDTELRNEFRELSRRLENVEQQLAAKTGTYMTLAQAAEYAGVSLSTIKRRKNLHRKIGRSVRIKRSDLERELARDIFV